MKKIAWQIVGYSLLIPGLIVLPTPIPIGLIMVAVALAILLATSRTIAGLVHRVRRRFPQVDARLADAEPRLPRSLRVPLSRTRAQRGRRCGQRAGDRAGQHSGPPTPQQAPQQAE
ncbi:putative transmembrane protein PGPGW [Rhodothalassium salexigens DSM 2132]|uniref:Putative transmembrane protein PGPGW n=1 Tax=Rhodothalassium salexigens DSM 2132 TaxID=1188247 RepID=A0A4V2SN84_RHOSA|nr:hypothetical protein [Rhodothalassium salexigens]MBB4212721.1 hypothetical protein [Rhodothalassium salexigens DSM 2132]MBK1639224.1 hypothetical protein [Rhodothalassium salexigens DSM 2132]TCP30176.1 putative transmembrane protein PGPGW [Rhodothalassium salexigens DSM 2132]